MLTYIGAAIAIAEMLDVGGDRAGAYDSLAVGWVTAGDRIGQAAAGGLFRPQLKAAAAVGDVEFARVRARTTTRRRSRAQAAERGTGGLRHQARRSRRRT